MATILNYEDEVLSQAKNRRATVEFITIVNDLWYDKSIELVLFRNPLVDKRASEVLNLISYAKEFVSKPISIQDALDIAKAIQQIDLPSSKLDIGKLAYECHLNPEKGADKVAFGLKKEVARQLALDVDFPAVIIFNEKHPLLAPESETMVAIVLLKRILESSIEREQHGHASRPLKERASAVFDDLLKNSKIQE